MRKRKAVGYSLLTMLLAAWFTRGIPVVMAAEPRLEKVDLFESRQQGYALYRIPGMVVTTKGTVLAYCEARKSGHGDWDEIDLMRVRSVDGGKSWLAKEKVPEAPGTKTKNPLSHQGKVPPAAGAGFTYNNPVAVADRDGSVHFVFCLEYMRCFYQRSDDDGATFGPVVEITQAFEEFRKIYDWKVLATGPGHGIQLRNGRLVVPVWLSTGTGGNAHRPSVTSVIYSDDHGRNWHAGGIAVPNTAEWVNPSEACVVELAGGRVLLNARTESPTNRRLVTVSPDGAAAWSKPTFQTELNEPICMGSMTSLPSLGNGGDLILFANPDNLARADGKEKPGQSRDRRNLSVKWSDDEGRSWSAGRPLEAGFSAYSDLAVLPDGTILCLYERNRETAGGRIGLLTMARCNREWLMGK